MNCYDSQPKVFDMLSNAFKNNRLAHAYLFYGEAGVFKYDTALQFVMMHYCKEEKPCQKCDNCKKILSENFLNLHIIKPTSKKEGSSKLITKEQMTELQSEFSKTSNIDGPRFYIIEDADLMNTQAQNSLLKFIEEPISDNTYAILTTSKIDKILPTIISRCALINFNSLSYDVLVSNLLKNNIDVKYANILPYISNNIQSCIELSKQSIEMKIIDLVYEFVIGLSKGNTMLFYRTHNEILSNKQNFLTFVNLLQVLYRDIYTTILDKSQKSFSCVSDELKVIAKNKNIDEIKKNLSYLMELESNLGYNVNISLLAVKLLIKLNGGIYESMPSTV